MRITRLGEILRRVEREQSFAVMAFDRPRPILKYVGKRRAENPIAPPGLGRRRVPFENVRPSALGRDDSGSVRPPRSEDRLVSFARRLGVAMSASGVNLRATAPRIER